MFLLRIIILFSIIQFTIANQISAQNLDTDSVEEMAKRAENTVRRAYDFLWEVRESIGLADTVRDPDRTGVIGVEYSSITTTIGYENAKHVSTQPGWASWLVRELSSRGIGANTKIAVSFSGSFPGINIAVLAALQELKADIKAISSVGASSWGANEPGFTWLEMERLLYEERIIKLRSGVVTIGGSGDRGSDFSDYALALAMESVKRSGLELLEPNNLRDAVRKRIWFYGDVTDYMCYINVGGGHASLGGGPAVRYSRGGWYFEPLEIRGVPDGVADTFLSAGVPVLNLLYLEQMALEFGILR